MCPDVLASNIGKELLIAIWLAVEDEATLVLENSGAKRAATEIQTQFEGHVEPGKVCRELDARNVMHRESRALD